ncbi:RNA binding protein [Diplocarpon rosae]|nr:RNA binding protein [Diplocarpon rosae]
MGKARTEASRAERKAKKRAAVDAIPDVPDSWAADPDVEVSDKKESKKRKRDRDAEDEEATALNGEKESKKEKKKRKKETEANGEEEEVAEKKVKERKVRNEEESSAAADVGTEMGNTPADGEPRKSKKVRKAERKAKDAAEAAANGAKATESLTAVPEARGDKKAAGTVATTEVKKSKKNNRNREKKRKGTSAATGANGESTEKGEESGKAARFIVFVGNLPFTATKASVEKHFASIKPKSVRVPCEKGEANKSKGYAFVEFEGYDHMKTCLKLFHHTMFDDKKSGPRQITCELTAGGGGNTDARRQKISEKNEKLNEERIRKIQAEKDAKVTKQAEGGKTIPDENAIHPSRRGRVAV